MSHTDTPLPPNKSIIDVESGPEIARSLNQHRLLTDSLGGILPEEITLSKQQAVLDLACGPGGWVLDVAYTCPDVWVVGVDLSRTTIEYARAQARAQRLDNATFVVMDVTDPSTETLLANAQLAEDLGYATVLLPDHLGDTFSPALLVAAIASLTSRIRLGSCMYHADLRHPVQLAKEVATLDVLSDGRFEFGVGVGQMRLEYEQAGLVFDPFPLRLERLAESLQLMKQLFTEESVTFHGTHYTVNDLQAFPRPIQRPHPPIFMGGGGKQMLSLAAREAAIIGLAPKGRPDGSGLEMRDALLSATVQKLAWLRQAAGNRLTHLEVSIQIIDMAVTPDRQQGAARLAVRYGLSTQELLASPHFLVGTIEQICDDLQARREQYGISYIVLWEEHLQALAPVVARLANW